METNAEQVKKWYEEYYTKKGEDRNDLLRNPGVLFQLMALQKALIGALRILPIDKNWKVLDVGCGSGASLLPFLGFGFKPAQLYGIDIIPGRIQQAEERLPNSHFVCADASAMDYPSAEFDIVTESALFTSLVDDCAAQAVADEILRVVKPKGYIILIDWRYSFGQAKYRSLSKRRINKLFKARIETTILCSKNAALIQPIGRFASRYLGPFYFLIQCLLPFLVGQRVTVLQK
jgi:ubiquinone/menaquinone biosynthesis C-methylase UbiE